MTPYLLLIDVWQMTRSFFLEIYKLFRAAARSKNVNDLKGKQASTRKFEPAGRVIYSAIATIWKGVINLYFLLLNLCVMSDLSECAGCDAFLSFEFNQ